MMLLHSCTYTSTLSCKCIKSQKYEIMCLELLFVPRTACLQSVFLVDCIVTLIHHHFPWGKTMKSNPMTGLQLLFWTLFNCFPLSPLSSSQRTPLIPPQAQPAMSNLCTLAKAILSAFLPDLHTLNYLFCRSQCICCILQLFLFHCFKIFQK